jgi:hypothetical protein
LFAELANVRAVASDVDIPGATVPVLSIDDVAAITEQVLVSAMTI